VRIKEECANSYEEDAGRKKGVGVREGGVHSPMVANMLNEGAYTRDMATYSVYILECADGSFYTGVTTDVDRRFKEHQAGTGARYTRSRGAVRMVYAEVCGTRSEAQKREASIKRLTRQEKKSLVARR
jgi:putative endonuclease